MSNKDSELKPLLEKLLSLYEVQIARFDKLEGTVRENTDAINRQETAINRQETAINRQETAINRQETALKRQETAINRQEAAIAALSKKVDDGFQKTALLIQSDRGEIAELRGALDVLGKRYDALVSLKRD